ncbi:MAG: hypothetical protein E7E23_17495, partial [Paenibacillus sp.]|uniref:hypothetical protein n=1 Tax=Paenibacillus sp. TaxID=58172 RepID=UPI0029050FEB
SVLAAPEPWWNKSRRQTIPSLFSPSIMPSQNGLGIAIMPSAPGKGPLQLYAVMAKPYSCVSLYFLTS